MSYFLIFGAALLRLLPHIPNFAPVGALALFGGTYLGRKQAIFIPLGAMVLSDIFIGFDSVASRAAVYGSFVLIGLIGMWLRSHKTAGNVMGATLAGSVIFFLITNIPALHPTSLYPNTLQGLMTSYVNGLPFFRGTLLGDFFYVGILFGGYEFARYYIRKRQAARSIVA